MRKTIVTLNYKFAMLFIALMGTLSTFAQDAGGASSTESHSSTTQSTSSTAPVVTNSDWYTQPWAWGLGILILVVLLFAIMRGNKTVSKTTVTRSTDNDV